MSNNITGSPGRFCNHILRALGASFLARQRNLKFNYGEYFSKMQQLGIDLFTTGSMTYTSQQIITDNDIMMLLLKNIVFKRNINVNYAYFQTKDFSNYLYNHFRAFHNQQSIIAANRFKERYNTNNDVFVHVRLTDVASKNQGFSYYDKALNSITFEKGYIASDDLGHSICQQLIQKYNLTLINYDEVETIMFGSTCKNIVLTGGSFSYIIGLFGFFSNIYYLRGNGEWYPPELFHIPSWTEISI
jgi:hypothetical protein